MLQKTFFFPHRLPLSSNNLPLTLISLEDWALVTLTGIDTIKYMQGQLTCNLATLGKNKYSFAAHCNAKGKTLSNLCIFHLREGGMSFIERRSVRDNQLTELKKYAVFSKITITADDQSMLIGVAGKQARSALNKIFDILPDTKRIVIHYHNATLLHFRLPAERFLLITNKATLDNLLHKLEGQVQINDSCQWLALDIEAGYPLIDAATSGKFIPQAINMQALNGICFNKGCYSGQEIVARAQYRTANKRALYWLVGKARRIPLAGDDLEIKIGINWRRTGIVLAGCQLENGDIWVQAVLNNDLSADTQLRVRGDISSILTSHTLPYTLGNRKVVT